MTFKELRKQSGMTQQRFAEYFGIPKRTIENWDAGVNQCPTYLLELMKYKLEHPEVHAQWEATEHYYTDKCSACGFEINWKDAEYIDLTSADIKHCPGCGARIE